MGVVFALQALPSTQLIAAAWLAACLAHPAPWRGALPASEGDGTARVGVQFCILPSWPSGPSPLPSPLWASAIPWASPPSHRGGSG